MFVLALDTSTPTVTAGVVELLRPHEIADATTDPCRVLAERSVVDAFGHAENLMPLVTEALDDADLTIGDLEAVVVGIGPGPFTGLRVGIVTAAALGDALNVPAHGIPSHDATAQSIAEASADSAFLVVTDARRREVYVSAYDANGRRRHGPVVVKPDALPNLLTENDLTPSFVAGAAADLAAPAAGVPVNNASASWSAGAVRCAARALLTGVVPGPLGPLYLRRPDVAEPRPPKAVLPQPEGVARSSS